MDIYEVQFTIVRLLLIPLLYPMNIIWYSWSKKAKNVSKNLIERILKDNQTTVFGLEYSFASIKDLNDYRKKVPLAESKDVQPYVHRMHFGGESNVLISADVAKYFLTSGTSSGPATIVPCSAVDLKFKAFLFGPMMMAQVMSHLGPATVYYRGMSALMSSRGESNSEYKTESGLRAGVKGFASPSAVLWTAPMEVNQLSSILPSYMLQWVFGLIYEDTAYILEEFSSKFIYLINVLLDNHEKIFRCIETGIPPSDLAADALGYQEITQALRASPRRANELRDIFKASCKRNHEGLVKAILPNLKYVACICTGSFSVYERSIRYYIGDTPIYNVAYGSSEAGYVGMSVGMNDDQYVLCPATGFFEFIPQDDEEVAAHGMETKLFNEMVPGKKYEVVCTTQSGLYRYRTHDIIQCTGYQNELPLFRFKYRDNVVLNLCSENVYGDQLQAAVKRVQEDRDIVFNYYSIAIDYEKSPPGYKFYVELAQSCRDDATKEMETKVEQVLANALCDINPRYKQREASGRISHPAVCFVKEGSYAELEQVMYEAKKKNGVSYGQIKVPTMLKAEGHDQWIKFLQSRRVQV